MADSEKTHVLMQDCIISQFGKVSAGFEISEDDVDSSTWEFLERNNMLKSIASIVADADANDVPDSGESDNSPEELASTDVEDNETESVMPDDDSVINTVKALLAGGKLQIKTIVQKTGIAEERISPLLTGENGFSKNQQGWFSLV